MTRKRVIYNSFNGSFELVKEVVLFGIVLNKKVLVVGTYYECRKSL